MHVWANVNRTDKYNIGVNYSYIGPYLVNVSVLLVFVFIVVEFVLPTSVVIR